MKAQKLLLPILIPALILLSGCATLFKGDTQAVPVTSEPAGAEVLVNGILMGTTPIKLKLKTNKTYTITIRKNGVSRTFTLTNKIGVHWVVLDALSGLLPVIIDAATGAWYELEPDQIHVVLE